jgi:hypothetical protein
VSHKKPDSRRQRHGEPPRLAVIRPDTHAATVPVPDARWLSPTRSAWTAFWRHGLAQLTEVVDEVAVRRLFGLYDARARVWALFLKEPLTLGSTRQKTVNPLGPFALALDARIEHIERAFGITPKARAALGITFAEAKKSLTELARDAAEGVERAASE